MTRPTICPIALLVCAITLLLTSGCDDMHTQPSFKPQEAPRRLPVATAVPQRGSELLDWATPLQNLAVPTEASRQLGKELFQINCSLCHEAQKNTVGKVGQKLLPPPPDLHRQDIQKLSDADLFKRISLGFGRMPPFRKWLTVTERWNLVNYLRTFNED